MDSDELNEKELVELEAKLQARSMSKGSSRRNPNRRIKMKYKDYVKRLTIFGTSIALATTILLNLGASIFRKMQDEKVLSMLNRDFKMTFMTTAGNAPEEIAQALKEQDGFDEHLYFLYQVLGPEETNSILSHTYYESLGGYFNSHNWNNEHDWQADMKAQLLGQHEIDQKQAELDQMAAEHQATTPADTTYGGDTK